jgi:hypothetical protein
VLLRFWNHPDVAVTLHNLAALCQGQGRDDEAEALSRRALGLFEKAFGPDNPPGPAPSPRSAATNSS